MGRDGKITNGWVRVEWESGDVQLINPRHIISAVLNGDGKLHVLIGLDGSEQKNTFISLDKTALNLDEILTRFGLEPKGKDNES